MSLSDWCRRWIFSQSISQHKSCSWISLAVAPLCRLRRLSLCSRCWRHIWLCWIVSRLQDPASLTISDAMKAMFVAMVCTKLADLYGILGNISAACHTFHWKQHSPSFNFAFSTCRVSRAKELLLPIVFNSLHLAIQKQTKPCIYIISINISIYHIPSLVTGVWWCLMPRCRSFRFLSKQVS